MVARGNLDHHAFAAAGLDYLNFLGNAAPEGEDLRLQSEAGDILNRGLVLFGDGGHARLDAVDSQCIELLGDRDFFFPPENHGGLLLAVAQGDVVQLDLRVKIKILFDLWEITPRADKPFICFPGLLHVASADNPNGLRRGTRAMRVRLG